MRCKGTAYCFSFQHTLPAPPGVVDIANRRSDPDGRSEDNSLCTINGTYAQKRSH